MSSSATALTDRISGQLEWRARLSARRPTSVRRHALRVLSRAAVLFATDVTALLAGRALLRALLASTAPAWAAQWDLIGPLASPGRPASMVFGIALLLALAVTGSYGRHRPPAAVVRVTVAVVLASVIAGTALAALVGVQQAAVQSAVVGAAALLVLIAARAVAARVLTHVWPCERWSAAAVAVGDEASLHQSVTKALKASGGDYTVTTHVPVGPDLARELRENLFEEDVEAVVVADGVSGEQTREILDVALGAGCQFLCPARALDIRGMHPRLVWHGGHAFLELGPLILRPSAVVAKRVTDVLGASFLLLLASPVMLLIALAVRLDSPGPAVFVQDRAGLGGRRFRMLKFHTMRDGADGEKQDLAHLNHSGDVRLFKIRSDPRITRVGRFLRRWSLDELPQLWNVLRGDMSLVGPRPFFESDFAAYEDHHFRRLDTKPGLTGLWQISGRSEMVDFEDVIFLDKQYIERWSLGLDLGILLRTIPAVMRRTGAF